MSCKLINFRNNAISSFVNTFFDNSQKNSHMIFMNLIYDFNEFRKILLSGNRHFEIRSFFKLMRQNRRYSIFGEGHYCDICKIVLCFHSQVKVINRSSLSIVNNNKIFQREYLYSWKLKFSIIFKLASMAFRMGSFCSKQKILNTDHQDEDYTIPRNISRFSLLELCGYEKIGHSVILRRMVSPNGSSIREEFPLNAAGGCIFQ